MLIRLLSFASGLAIAFWLHTSATAPKNITKHHKHTLSSPVSASSSSVRIQTTSAYGDTQTESSLLDGFN